jgi:hypothetical protein
MWHAWERREKCIRFWRESPKEGDHSEDTRKGEDGIGMILIVGRLAGRGRVEWIQLTQDRDRWRALVNTMNLRVLAPRS